MVPIHGFRWLGVEWCGGNQKGLYDLFAGQTVKSHNLVTDSGLSLVVQGIDWQDFNSHSHFGDFWCSSFQMISSFCESHLRFGRLVGQT
jgi:hypothetical protein